MIGKSCVGGGSQQRAAYMTPVASNELIRDENVSRCTGFRSERPTLVAMSRLRMVQEVDQKHSQDK